MHKARFLGSYKAAKAVGAKRTRIAAENFFFWLILLDNVNNVRTSCFGLCGLFLRMESSVNLVNVCSTNRPTQDPLTVNHNLANRSEDDI